MSNRGLDVLVDAPLQIFQRSATLHFVVRNHQFQQFSERAFAGIRFERYAARDLTLNIAQLLEGLSVNSCSARLWHLHTINHRGDVPEFRTGAAIGSGHDRAILLLKAVLVNSVSYKAIRSK